MLSLFDKLTGKSLVADDIECVARVRRFGETHYLNGNGRTCGIDLLTSVVRHNTNSADRGAGDNYITRPERTVLNKECRYRASALIKSRFDDNALTGSVRVSLKLGNLGNEKYGFEQVIYAHMSLS